MEQNSQLEDALKILYEIEFVEHEKTKDQNEMTEHMLNSALDNGEKALASLCAKPAVKSALTSFGDEFRRQSDILEKLKRISFADPQAIADGERDIEIRRQSPMMRLTERVLGNIALSETAEFNKARHDADLFLSRPPEVVAEELEGMKLIVGRRKATITNVRPQSRKDTNPRYIKSKPIFGKDRVDAYVANFRGIQMLFFRAGDNKHNDCCVAIQGIEHNGEILNKPSYVTQEFELAGEQIADLELMGDSIKIVNLRPREK